MRIVQINGGAKGSTGKIMMGIADIAKLQGHEVMCASPITSTKRDAGKIVGIIELEIIIVDVLTLHLHG